MLKGLKEKANKMIRKGSLISLSLMIMIIPQAALAASSLEMAGISEPEEMTPDAAKKGIVRVIAGTENEDGNFERKAVSSGFIVSDTGGEVRIVTTLHSVDFGENSRVRVAVKNGLTVDAAVEKFPERDFCILTAENKFNDKDMIPIRVPGFEAEDSTVAAGDAVTVLGFPASVGESSDYADSDVSAQSGTITKTAAENGGYIETGAIVPDGCDGGALTDENGYVIGLVNTKTGKAMDITEADTALYKEGAVYRSKDKDEMYAELYELCAGAEDQYKKADKETKSEISRVYNAAIEVLENAPYDRDALRSALDDYKGVAGDIKRSKKPLILIMLLAAVIVYLSVRLVMLVKWDRQHGGEMSRAEPAGSGPAGTEAIMTGSAGTGSDRPAAQPHLVVLRTGAEYTLYPQTFTMGKSGSADISIPDNNKISRDHAGIEFRDGAYYLYDRGSTNGTYLNNSPVGPEGVRLISGDLIRLADEDLKYY